jgi:hypothetical protein
MPRSPSRTFRMRVAKTGTVERGHGVHPSPIRARERLARGRVHATDHSRRAPTGNRAQGRHPGPVRLLRHAGGGINVNVSPTLFVGAEGRYVWADPSIGGERIQLNSDNYSLDAFKLNGFTTTLVVGFGF